MTYVLLDNFCPYLYHNRSTILTTYIHACPYLQVTACVRSRSVCNTQKGLRSILDVHWTWLTDDQSPYFVRQRNYTYTRPPKKVHILAMLPSMLLVTNLANTKWCEKPEKWLKPWHNDMGTYLRVLHEGYPMSTTMQGFRCFSKIFAFLCIG